MTPDGRFVAIWESSEQDGSSWGVFGQRYDAAGNPEGDEFQVNTYTQGEQKQAAVAMAPDGRFVAVWQSNEQDGNRWGIFGQRYDAAGNPEGDEFQVNTYTLYDQKWPAVAMASGGHFIVVWESAGQDGSSLGIFSQRYNSDGSRIGDEFQVNTHIYENQKRSAVAMASDGHFVVVWESAGQDGSRLGIFGQRYDVEGNQLGFEFQVNAYIVSDQKSPAVEMAPDGRFIVVWDSSGIQDEDWYGIFAQRYGADGAPLGLLPW